MNARSGLFAWIATLAVVVLVPAAAQAADFVVNDATPDGAGTGPLGADCTVPAAFTAIQPAIDAANPAGGDRVLVCPGIYTEPATHQVTIAKPVSLIGSGPGVTIIDGGNFVGLTLDGTVRVTATADVTVRSLTVRNPASRTATSNTFDIYAQALAANTLYRFDELELIGQGGGATDEDYGFYIQQSSVDVELTDSVITNTDANPVLLEQYIGSATIADNFISQAPVGVADLTTSAIGYLAHAAISGGAAWDTNAPQRITRNVIDANGQTGISLIGALANITGSGRITAADVTDNVITDVGGGGISLANQAATIPANGEIADPVVQGNSITGSVPLVALSRGIALDGLVSNAKVRSNSISGVETAIRLRGTPVAAPNHWPLNLQVHFNRIAPAPAGLSNVVASTVDATNNWWGCNEGPGLGGCAPIVNTGGGSVSFNPWLVLGIGASPTTIETGGQVSEVSADLTTNSAGDDVGGFFPDQIPVGFATTLGSIATPRSTQTGVAQTLLTSAAVAGTASASATLDAETVTTPVTIEAPDATVTIVKDAQPNSDQDFAFTTTGSGLSDFSLDDDADGTLSNQQVFTIPTAQFGAKSITESSVGGWTWPTPPAPVRRRSAAAAPFPSPSAPATTSSAPTPMCRSRRSYPTNRSSPSTPTDPTSLRDQSVSARPRRLSPPRANPRSAPTATT